MTKIIPDFVFHEEYREKMQKSTEKNVDEEIPGKKTFSRILFSAIDSMNFFGHFSNI